MQDVDQTIISQYGQSPRLTQLIYAFNQWVDPTYNFDQFFANIWDIRSANGYGLDVWGRIVGVSRVLTVNTASPYFGFKQQTEAEPFNQAPFYNGAISTPGSQNVNLVDSAFKNLILAKSLLNLTNGSAPSVNAILIFLFFTNVPGRTGQAYCTDPGGMAMTYTFQHLNPALTPVELAIINQSGVLPRPSGVAATVVQIA